MLKTKMSGEGAGGSMTDNEWLTSMGLCHRCRRAKAAPGKKFCFDCLDKFREEGARRYDPGRAREYQERRREIYRQKKKDGICVRCNKKATQGLFCLECSIKVKRHNAKTSERRKEERHRRGLIPEQREKDGICLKCGNPLSTEDKENGYKVCLSCREKLNEYAEKGRENSPWRKDEKERYDKNRRWRNEHIQAAVQKAE